jgi:hypothetical protein
VPDSSADRFPRSVFSLYVTTCDSPPAVASSKARRCYARRLSIVCVYLTGATIALLRPMQHLHSGPRPTSPLSLPLLLMPSSLSTTFGFPPPYFLFLRCIAYMLHPAQFGIPAFSTKHTVLLRSLKQALVVKAFQCAAYHTRYSQLDLEFPLC